jgi:hypothetical protein
VAERIIALDSKSSGVMASWLPAPVGSNPTLSVLSVYYSLDVLVNS